MKQLSKTILLFSAVAAIFITLSSFIINEKKKETISTASYTITFNGIETIGTTERWSWTVSNPNPGNGSNGTLQNISHWDIPLCAAAEAALVGAEYSTDGGITWVSVPLEIERDPSIRLCTTTDVLKFNIGTIGTAPNNYRITFNQMLSVNRWATSYIKTGGGLQGCNMYDYVGVGCEIPTGGTRNY